MYSMAYATPDKHMPHAYSCVYTLQTTAGITCIAKCQTSLHYTTCYMHVSHVSPCVYTLQTAAGNTQIAECQNTMICGQEHAFPHIHITESIRMQLRLLVRTFQNFHSEEKLFMSIGDIHGWRHPCDKCKSASVSASQATATRCFHNT
jgi:hypothetical protein